MVVPVDDPRDGLLGTVSVILGIVLKVGFFQRGTKGTIRSFQQTVKLLGDEAAPVVAPDTLAYGEGGRTRSNVIPSTTALKTRLRLNQYGQTMPHRNQHLPRAAELTAARERLVEVSHRVGQLLEEHQSGRVGFITRDWDS